MATENSDVDVKGVFIAPINFYFGFNNQDNFSSVTPDFDYSLHEVRKFCGLAANCNPNILEVLWCEDEDVIHQDYFGDRLRRQRASFLSKVAADAYSGYARSQVRKMESLNIETLEKFEKLEEELLSNGMSVQELNLTQDQRNFKSIISGKKLETVLNDYLQVKNKYFSGGKLGEKRKDLIKKFQYDTKNGSHLIRLLRTGCEIFEYGQIFVKRPDAKQLLGIRNGEWTLEQVKEEAERLFARMEILKEKSNLPKKCDMEKVEDLVISILRGYYA